MNAAVLVAPRRVEIQDVPTPEPGPGEVRLRLEGSGVCASNLPAFEGRPWFTYPLEAGGLGHEGWGIVEALGPGVQAPPLGQRVAAISYRAFADYDVARAEHCVALPPALSARPFPGEPLACAMNVFRRAQIEPGAWVAIVGAGFLGLLLTELARAAGARVIAASRRSSALEAALAKGAEVVVPLGGAEPGPDTVAQQAILEATGGEGCACAIECTGKQGPLDLASAVVRIRGRLVIAGYHQDGPRQVDMQSWNWRGLDVVNAHERDPAVYVQGLRAAVGAVLEGRLDPAPLITHALPLERLDDALTLALERPEGFLKAVVTMA